MFLSTAVIVVGLALRKRMKFDYVVLWISGTFYALGLFLFGNAADSRLLFYTNYVYCLMLLLLLFEVIGALAAQKNRRIA